MKKCIEALKEKIAQEKIDVDGWFIDRGERALSDEDVDPMGDRENCVWEAGMIYGMEFALKFIEQYAKK